MSLTLFNAVPAGAIETVFDDQNQPWFKRADLRRYLGIVKVKNSMHIPSHFMCKRQDIKGVWPTVPLGKRKNSHDVFVNLDGAIYIATNSKKEKAAALISWFVKKGVEKLQEEHQVQIEGKDAAIALLNDDLDDVGKQLVELEHENRELQNEVERLQERYVPYLQDTRKDNGMVVIQKNNGDEYPYVAICGQQGYVTQKIQNKLADYPNGQLVVLAETPKAIVHYSWLRERGCIITNPERVRCALHASPVNGAAGGVGSLVSCEIYQKINVHKTPTYSYIYRPYWCWKNTSGSRYDRDPIQQAF